MEEHELFILQEKFKELYIDFISNMYPFKLRKDILIAFSMNDILRIEFLVV